jgi:hypothetical protein
VIAVEPIGIAKEPEVRHLRRELQRGEDEIHHHAKRLGQERFWEVLSEFDSWRWWGRRIHTRGCRSGGYLPRNGRRTLREEGIEATCERRVSEKLPHLVLNLPLEFCGGPARL